MCVCGGRWKELVMTLASEKETRQFVDDTLGLHLCVVSTLLGMLAHALPVNDE